MTISTSIRVRGTHETEVLPDEATMSIVAGADSDSRDAAVTIALEAASALRAEIDRHTVTAAVARFSVDQVHVTSHRPWNKDGDVRPPRYEAAIRHEVTFTDFGALSEFVVAAAAMPGISIGFIDWGLEKEHRRTLELEAAQSAVSVVVARAQAYADALGLGAVRALSIADQGMLGSHLSMRAEMASVAMLGASDGPSVDLEPEMITVAATIDAEFMASAPEKR